MKLETIIDLYGSAFKKNLIIKRELHSDTTFKAYKTYKITLFEHTKEGNKELLSEEITDKIIDTNKDKVIESVEKKFLSKVIKYYGN